MVHQTRRWGQVVLRALWRQSCMRRHVPGRQRWRRGMSKAWRPEAFQWSFQNGILSRVAETGSQVFRAH